MHDGGVFSTYLMCCVCGADVGISSDFDLSNTRIQLLPNAPLVPVFFTLRVDGVSQEINETFSITLILNPGTTAAADFFPTVTVSITDVDSEFPNSPMIHY